MSARNETPKSAVDEKPAKFKGFTAEEKAAMREHIKEQKAAAAGVESENAVLAKIAEMVEPDRSMAAKIHAIAKEDAPELTPRLWYGMPAYGMDGKIIFFFQDAQKFKARYATLGFNDGAKLDDGEIWPAAFALKALTPTVEAKIKALILKAVGRVG